MSKTELFNTAVVGIAAVIFFGSVIRRIVQRIRRGM